MGDERFDGQIIGFGTASGTRVVVGDWWASPFGRFADVMVERPDGHRVLVAPPDVAEFVAATYSFDEVVESSVVSDAVPALGPASRPQRLTVRAGPLTAVVRTGPRTPLGRAVRLVPARVARSVGFARAVDPLARVLGLRTYGTAGSGRHEAYGATDVRRVLDVEARWDGADLGALADVDPPVRFGFGSSPRRPCATRIVTTVRTR
ncbi:hypothetical protein CLV28_2152 [Sediminihabitans luteus]|uniref:Uncharacterized protein n=1 Tax=Sediminihabitans luteus TaxID=1138585 RepID=A0A2M9CEN7_9CELL|nr:hypothetical protein [Sediminihabitans luteus]PJJ70320.1 hypothetical protein CLV28_2152 [Sediminihabitans luteus]GII97791.1 hypothetical protein Slu03_01690 [Sediminihabitans luteus]